MGRRNKSAVGGRTTIPTPPPRHFEMQIRGSSVPVSFELHFELHFGLHKVHELERVYPCSIPEAGELLVSTSSWILRISAGRKALQC